MYNNFCTSPQVTDKDTLNQLDPSQGYIVNPVTRRPVKLLTPKGKEILRHYLVKYGEYLDCLTSHK